MCEASMGSAGRCDGAVALLDDRPGPTHSGTDRSDCSAAVESGVGYFRKANGTASRLRVWNDSGRDLKGRPYWAHTERDTEAAARWHGPDVRVPKRSHGTNISGHGGHAGA